MAIRAMAFDLDDTLLDTTNLLVPAAANEAFSILIRAGLSLSPEECEKSRIQLIKSLSHKDVFEKLAREHGSAETLAALAVANQTFYHPNLPDSLPLLEGALENIQNLSTKYSLYVVTAGLKDAQERKIAALGIAPYFKDYFIVNSLNKERKIHAFRRILEIEGLEPSQLFCIGNSLGSEIRDAQELGAVSCFFDFGEDRGNTKKLETIKPTYHIHHHRDLIPVCKL
jgi:putative hydrolase of the HAD superfamily